MANSKSSVVIFLTGVLVSISVKVAGNARFIQSLNPNLVWIPILIGTAYALVLEVVRGYQWYKFRAPSAVEVFLLNPQGKLCLYYHPLHKMRLPPGGRVRRFETLHEAVKRCLKDRLGLDPTQYELFSVNPAANSSAVFSNIVFLPCPFRVQEERHSQRAGKALHTDFFFAARLRDGHQLIAQESYKPVDFCDVEQVEGLVAKKETYADVADAYDALLAQICDQN